MKPSTTKKLAMILALFLVAALLVSLVASLIATGFAAESSSSLQKLKDNQKALADQKKKIVAEIASIKSERTSAVQHKAALDQQIDITEQEIENMVMLINELTDEIARKQTEYEQALLNEQEEYELFLTRVRVMEESGRTDYMGILLASDTFDALLSRAGIISDILAYDREVIRRLQDARIAIDRARQELEGDKQEQIEHKKAMAVRQSELVEEYAQADMLIEELRAEEEAFKKAYEEAEAEEKKLQDEVKKLMAELARKNTVYVGGDWGWPIPGYSNITSPFGNRYHPILKYNKLHTGTDISAPIGAKIIASNSGTVVTAGYNSGYGKYVVIDHGGGWATLYAHMSSISVSKNQKVSKGDTVGKVGNTGMSTGPHLHFEIIKDGTHQNPMKYFKEA